MFPACAGMYRLDIASAESACCVPRMRGDVPQWDDGLRAFNKCSPHARGCTEIAYELLEIGSVFPACAGMYRPDRRGQPDL